MQRAQMTQKTLIQKRTQISVSIRRDHKLKIFQQLHKKLYQTSNFPKISTLVDQFQLSENPRFKQGSIQKDSQFILLDILFARQQNLIRITFKKKQMIDQKLLPQKNTKFQINQVPLPKKYDFSLHSGLYDSISSDIFQHEGKYKGLKKQHQEKMITFFIKYLSRNKYMQISKQKSYHQSMINLLSLLVIQIQSPYLRQLILCWVGGTQSLLLIFNCLSGQFLNQKMHQTIYKIILQGLRHIKPQTKLLALDVLLKCIKQADYDDIQSLLLNNSPIYMYLLLLFSDQQIKKQLYSNKQYMDSYKKAAFCICVFLEAYDVTVLYCLREGAGYVGACLICEQEQELVANGLTIFQHIANIADVQYARQALVFLLTDNSIAATGVWKKIGQTYQVFNSGSVKVLRQLTAFLSNFMAHGQFEVTVQLGRFFDFKKGQNLVDMLINCFIQSNDPIILQNTISCFKSLIFYGQLVTQLQSQIIPQKYNQINENLDQKFQGTLYAIRQNTIVFKISDSEMLNKLNQISKQKETQSKIYPQKIVNLTDELLVSMERFSGRHNLQNKHISEFG